MHPSERPRERCLEQGAACLSLRECLALILGSGPRDVGSLGLAAKILEQPGPGLSAAEEARAFFTSLEVAPSAHLQNIRGLGDAGRARIIAAFELGRRYAAYREQQRRSPSTASFGRVAQAAIARVPEARRHDAEEWLAFVPVHRSGEVGDFCLVERGVRTHVNTDAVELFSRILALRPQGVFLFHNHPTSELTASPQDRDLTDRVAELAARFEIRMLGHFIVTSAGERLVV